MLNTKAQALIQAIEILKAAGAGEGAMSALRGELAEELAAVELNGEKAAARTTGYDVLSPEFGRVEVKSKTLTGKGETISMGNKTGRYDHLLVVVFDKAGAVVSMKLYAHDDIEPTKNAYNNIHVDKHGDVKYKGELVKSTLVK
ncbi:hypothetical protein [Vibrio sp. WXL210]|uniref:hypothetical protein n=1 Tax=Vibrio sp. WXL210 TaxID=3450709 RepID=UPI003EC8BD65